jgi:hypothetical protein
MTFNEAWNRKVPDFFCPYCNKTLSGSISPDDLIDVARSLNKLQVNLQNFKNDEDEKDKE